MGDVAELVKPPDYGDGDDGGEYAYCHECEYCEGDAFAVWFIDGIGRLVCTECHKPQESVFCMGVGGE